MAAAVLAVAAGILLWTRLIPLDHGFWHDEVYSVRHYTSQGPGEILFGEYVPNNHVVFNLLAWLTTQSLGDESEATYRLWSVAPAIAAVAVVAVWAWRRLGPPTAAIFAVLVVASPLHLELAMQARGYGLTFLAAALLLIAADRLAGGAGRGWLAGFCGAGLLGSGTLPIFAPTFAGQALALLGRPELRRRIAIGIGVVALVGLLLYAPLLGGLLDSTGQRFGHRLPWHGFASGPLTELATPSLQLIEPEGRLRFLYLAVAAVAGLGAARLWRRSERQLVLTLVVPLAFTYAALTAARIFVEWRFTSFLLFHLALLVAAGVAAIGEWLGRPRFMRPAVAVAGATLALVAGLRALEKGREVADRPIEAFKQVAALVEGTGIGRVVSNSTRPEALWYYLGRDRVRLHSPERLVAIFCGSRGPLVYVEHPFRASAAQPPPPEVGCLERRGAVRVRFPERARERRLDVWVLGPPPVGRLKPG